MSEETVLTPSIEKRRELLEEKTKEELIAMVISLSMDLSNVKAEKVANDPMVRLDALKIAKDIELENYRTKPISDSSEITIEHVMARSNVLLNYILTT